MTQYLEFGAGKKYSTTQSAISSTPDGYRDCGIILEDRDYVVDIDTLPKETIKAMIKAFDISTQIVWTDRGAHLYFKRPPDFTRGANRISPLGFTYEIKHTGNTRAVTVKRNGKLREIENEGVREHAPFILSSSRKYDVLLGYTEGDGRNQALFKLRARIGGQKEWRDILNFVNEHIFDKPIPDDEMVTLTREMVITAERGNEYQIAKWIMSEIDFLQYGVTYYFKSKPDSDEYTNDEDILKRIVYDRVGEQDTRYVDEVIKQMKYRCRKLPQDTVFDIKFTNGYLRDGEFVDLQIVDFTPYKIDVAYNPDAPPVEIVDEYLDHLTKGDKSYRDLLMEVLGHTLVVNPEFKRLLAKFFIFIGEGGNGKGTLLQIIKAILGTENVTGMSIRELSDERYLASLKGRLANLGDDLQDQAIDDKDMKVLKNITTCDYISTRELYKQAESMYFTASLIFTSNHVIKSFEKGKSYKRRVLWLPMFTEVKKKDPLFITKLTTKESLEYWIRLIVEGYMRLYTNNDFTESDIVNDYNKAYHEENNPYLLYIDGKTAEDFIGEPVAEIARNCQEWCEDNDVKYSQKMFYNTMREVLRVDNKGTTRDRGSVVKVWKAIE